MRILYVLRSVQHPLIMRGALRHYHLMKKLAEQHSITLLALTYGELPAQVAAELTDMVDTALLFPVVNAPALRSGPARVRWAAQRLAERQAIRRMRLRFLALASEGSFDLVLFHGKAVYPVIDGFHELPVVVDFCDATTLRQRERLRHARLWQAPWRLAAYAAACRTERRLLAHTRHLAFISHRDREAVLRDGGRAAVIPNGIDLDYWRRGAGEPRANRLVFTGVMDYPPNEDAALYLIEQILPLLQRSRPDIELYLVGMNPSAAVRAAAAANPAVNVTGFVHDLRPYMEESSVYVAPLRYASGLQNKILEALAIGLPVVTTPIVADGLRGHDDPPPLRVASGATDFAECILSLLADRDEQRRLAIEGRRFVETHYNWDSASRMLEALCAGAAHTTESHAAVEEM